MYFFGMGWGLNQAETALGLNSTNLFTNGGFDSDTAWTKQNGWTIAGGVAVGTASPAGQMIKQTPSPAIIAGHTYRITFTLVATIGGVAAGSTGFAYLTARTTSGTFQEDFVADPSDAGADFGIYSDTDFTGTIDNISLTDIT